MKPILFLLLLASTMPAQSQAVLAALATGTYFPLDVGDRWVFRIDTRSVTGSYQTWRVDRTEEHGGKVWAVIAIEDSTSLLGEAFFRADEQGRIFQLTGIGEALFLDPTDQPATGAALEVRGRVATFSNALGTFPDALQYRSLPGSLLLESGTLVRGIGVVASEQDVIGGSSGGFSLGRTLVEASLAGGLQLRLNAPSLQLGLESLTLNVSGKEVTNCAVPCYFVACGLVPGADPANTYKPCARARVQLSNWPVGASRSVRLQLVAADGLVAVDKSITLDSAVNDSVGFVQLPLYSAPNQALAAGQYQLVARTSGAQSSITVQIQ